MESWGGWGGMEIYVSEYDAMNQIFPDSAHRTFIKYLPHIQNKYKVFTSSTETNH